MVSKRLLKHTNIILILIFTLFRSLLFSFFLLLLGIAFCFVGLLTRSLFIGFLSYFTFCFHSISLVFGLADPFLVALLFAGLVLFELGLGPEELELFERVTEVESLV